jgi:hypothetical protein
MRGRISPNVMAMMIRNAVAPFAATLVSRAVGAVGPIETNSTSINETTAEKARAAKGKARTLTSVQATSAPVAAFVPATEISAQIDHRRSGLYAAHVNAERFGGDYL